jgi:hypothetical protein
MTKPQIECGAQRLAHFGSPLWIGTLTLNTLQFWQGLPVSNLSSQYSLTVQSAIVDDKPTHPLFYTFFVHTESHGSFSRLASSIHC